MHAVLQVELALPLHDVWEQIAVEGRVVGEKTVQTQLPFGGDQLIQSYRARWDRGPLAGRKAMLGVRLAVLDLFEDHDATRPLPGAALPPRCQRNDRRRPGFSLR